MRRGRTEEGYDDARMNYRERLYPSPWGAVALLLLIPAIIVVCAPINPIIGYIVGPGLYVLIVVIAYGTSPVIIVTPTTVQIGRVTIPSRFLANPVILDARERRLALSTELDARAYLRVRGARIPMLNIAVTDPDDPTPYWLVSTRRPDELHAALIAVINAPAERPPRTPPGGLSA